MKKLITKLIRFLKKGDEIKAEAIKEDIIESIEEVIEEELFFSLPTSEIVNIIQNCNISDAETYSTIINRLSETKGSEVALILNVVEPKEVHRNCFKLKA